MSTDLRFTSHLTADYRAALEELMFFNPAQQVALPLILDSIEAFGEPAICEDGERLRVRVGELAGVQALFALAGDDLAGVLIYTRVDHQRLVVLHLAVAPRFAATGERRDTMLVMRLLQTLRRNARRVKGVQSIVMMYGNERFRELPV